MDLKTFQKSCSNPMSSHAPPTIDPRAAARWHAAAPAASPWLHEEVARRMQERLQWMAHAPGTWCHWDPLRGGIQGHALIAQRFPQAACHVVETSSPAGQAAVRAQWHTPWWKPWQKTIRFGLPKDNSIDMLWANMALHMAANPLALLADWQRALAPQGYIMFSCLGPDTLRELRHLYNAQGWPAPAHTFTDMHDWGDMLVHTGFAEPVLDMERITLTFSSPARLLQELRELGRNLHPERFAALRARRWRAQLEQALADIWQNGPLALTFEIIYGHAIKPAPRIPMQQHSSVSLQEMQSMLRTNRPPVP